jgi:hypothetical protein
VVVVVVVVGGGGWWWVVVGGGVFVFHVNRTTVGVYRTSSKRTTQV